LEKGGEIKDVKKDERKNEAKDLTSMLPSLDGEGVGMG